MAYLERNGMADGESIFQLKSICFHFSQSVWAKLQMRLMGAMSIIITSVMGRVTLNELAVSRITSEVRILNRRYNCCADLHVYRLLS